MEDIKNYLQDQFTKTFSPYIDGTEEKREISKFYYCEPIKKERFGSDKSWRYKLIFDDYDFDKALVMFDLHGEEGSAKEFHFENFERSLAQKRKEFDTFVKKKKVGQVYLHHGVFEVRGNPEKKIIWDLSIRMLTNRKE